MVQCLGGKLVDMNRDLIDNSSKFLESAQEFENELLKYEQIDLNVKHFYINGMYAREITIPKGAMITSRVHAYGYVDIMISGDITIITDAGKSSYSGYNLFEGFAGKKRVGLAHTEVKWITIHNVPNRDDASENFYDKLTYDSVDSYSEFAKEQNKISYEKALEVIGVSADTVDEQSKNTKDIDTTTDSKFSLDNSTIDGFGLFSKEFYNAGDVIGCARKDGLRTILGRKVNHSYNPNLLAEERDGDIVFIASRLIRMGDELFNDYIQTRLMSKGKGEL
jgi:hypothetical protein